MNLHFVKGVVMCQFAKMGEERGEGNEIKTGLECIWECPGGAAIVQPNAVYSRCGSDNLGLDDDVKTHNFYSICFKE